MDGTKEEKMWVGGWDGLDTRYTLGGGAEFHAGGLGPGEDMACFHHPFFPCG